MSPRNLAVSTIALAVMQAYAPAALAQATTTDADAVMTEVIVSASKNTNAKSASVAGFSDAPLLLTPASVTVLTREQMQDLNIRSTTDAARFDASLGDAYSAVGYAEQFSIRGFKLNNANSYRKDGLAISGDTQIPLENKESLQVLKGLAGLQAGVASPGGIVDYVVKRPTDTPLRTAVIEASERGTVLGTVDVGGRFEDRRFGYRVNVAGERLRSYIKGADGHRNFVSGAFDWQITPQALLQLDADYQKKSQVTAPGFQLFDGVALPTGVAADTMLNRQPWTRPVETESSNIGLRFQYQFSPAWRATVSANRHSFKRDDYTAFPGGCGDIYPGYCSNGDYDIYDYKSLGEQKKPMALQAMLQGQLNTGAVRHALTAGYSYFKNSERWGDYLYEWVGTSNIHHPVAVPEHTGSSGPVSERRSDHERALFAQDVIGLTDSVSVHAGVRHAQLKRREVIGDGIADANTDKGFWLPNVALVYQPAAHVTLYGSWAQGLEHGGIAPIETRNENQALAAGKSKQIEFGAKAELGAGLSVAASVFEITKGLEYTDATNTYVRNGEARHRGLELSAQGRLTRAWTIGATAMALDAEQDGTGQPALDGKRVTNVPKFKSSVYAEYTLEQIDGVKLNANWQHAGRKAFDPENKVFVGSYNVLNVGGSYATRIGGRATVLRAQVNNALDKFYWRDVTQDLGGYLFPGAERTVKLSAQVDF